MMTPIISTVKLNDEASIKVKIDTDITNAVSFERLFVKVIENTYSFTIKHIIVK